MTRLHTGKSDVNIRLRFAFPADFTTLWRLGGLAPGQLLRRSVNGFREHQLDARSAQFAFYAMLAIAPLLIVIIAIVAQFPIQGAQVLDSFRHTVGAGMPDSVYRLIERQIE